MTTKTRKKSVLNKCYDELHMDECGEVGFICEKAKGHRGRHRYEGTDVDSRSYTVEWE